MVVVYMLWESGCLGVVLYSDTDIGATALLLLLLGAIRFLIAGSNTYFGPSLKPRLAHAQLVLRLENP